MKPMSNATVIVLLAVAAVFVAAAVAGRIAYNAGRATVPAAYRHYEHTLADMQLRLERTEQRSDRQQEQIDRLREALAQEQDYSRALARAMREAGLEPPRRPDAATVPAAAALTDTARRLAGLFSVSELDDLAMEAGLLEVVAGESAEQRASSLALAALRRGTLAELRAIARRERPQGGF